MFPQGKPFGVPIFDPQPIGVWRSTSPAIGVLFGCFGGKIDGDFWFT